jgi:hypothetical protein
MPAPAGDELVDPRELAKRIRKALLAITKHYDSCLTPVRRAPGSHASAAAFASLPISATILDDRAQCRTRLAYWCDQVIRARDLHTEHLSFHDVAAMCDLLQRHSDWLGETVGAAIAMWELEDSAGDLRSIAVSHRRDWMPLGPCPLVNESEDGEPEPCTGTVRAYPTCDPYCDVCETSAVVTWWEHQMFGDTQPTNLVTAPALVLAIHREFGQVIKEATIRQWVTRGVIETKGKDSAGRSLYDRVDVAYALARRGSVRGQS